MFDNGSALLLLLLVPLAIGFFLWRSSVRDRRRARIGERDLVATLVQRDDTRQRRWQSALWLMVLVSVIVALARPLWGLDDRVIETQGKAIIIVLDVSASMDAEDVQPSRIERAKLAAQQVFTANAGSEMGLILFAGGAFVQLPLTTDVNAAMTFLSAAATDSITQQGTALEVALRLALQAFDERIAAQSAIVVLSDGEYHQGEPLRAAEEAAVRGIPIHVLGYGDPIDGAPIPVEGQADGLYKLDSFGNLVITRLNEDALRDVAGLTGGVYRRAGESGVATADLLNALDDLGEASLGNRNQPQRIERFGWFVALALVALSLEMLMPDLQRVPLTTLAASVLLIVAACGVNTAERNNRGNALVGDGEYEAALRAYQVAQANAPDQAEPYYNAAAAYFGLAELDSAIAALEQAVARGDDALAAAAYYNMGNILYELALYGEAIQSYQQALLINPDDAAARYNLELAQRRFVPPTPTAQEQQTAPELGQTDPDVTPTNQPGGFDGPTPTPPPEESAPDPEATPETGNVGDGEDDSATPVPRDDGEMTVEQAERLLDAIQQDQQSLREYLREITVGGGDSGDRDW